MNNSQFCYHNFRSLINDSIYDVPDQKSELNYNNQLIVSRSKLIDDHQMEGIYVESEFRHQCEGDLRSDYVHSGIFDE